MYCFHITIQIEIISSFFSPHSSLWYGQISLLIVPFHSFFILEMNDKFVSFDKVDVRSTSQCKLGNMAHGFIQQVEGQWPPLLEAHILHNSIFLYLTISYFLTDAPISHNIFFHGTSFPLMENPTTHLNEIDSSLSK